MLNRVNRRVNAINPAALLFTFYISHNYTIGQTGGHHYITFLAEKIKAVSTVAELMTETLTASNTPLQIFTYLRLHIALSIQTCIRQQVFCRFLYFAILYHKMQSTHCIRVSSSSQTLCILLLYTEAKRRSRVLF